MKVAIKYKDIFANYSSRFSDYEIQLEPYNYTIVEVPNDVCVSKLEYSDFENNVFNYEKYKLKLDSEKMQNYGNLVEKYIREKYSVSQEMSLLRQQALKPGEFTVYTEFCENCKKKAKAELGLV